MTEQNDVTPAEELSPSEAQQTNSEAPAEPATEPAEQAAAAAPEADAQAEPETATEPEEASEGVEAAASDEPEAIAEEAAPEAEAEPEPEMATEPEEASEGVEAAASDEPEAIAEEVSPEAEAKAEPETVTEPEAKTSKSAKVVEQPEPKTERPEVTALRAAQESKETVDGKVIGWNNGGLHVVVSGITAFCPRSEIEIGAPKGPEAYVDKTFPFVVLRVQKRGRRIVLSRRALLQGDRDEKIETLRTAMRAGEVLEGKVSSLTDFGAFVDLGGIDGLIHVSEISRSRVNHASEALSQGDSVKVRILKISDDGSRVSLSAKALEPDPWDGIEDRFPAGEMVKGTVERTADFGAFVEIAPGLTGLLPTSAMNLPRDASPARVYQPGKEVSVQILSIDRRRHRISLALEGSQVEGTRADLKSYQDSQGDSTTSFGSLAAAFEKARKKS